MFIIEVSSSYYVDFWVELSDRVGDENQFVLELFLGFWLTVVVNDHKLLVLAIIILELDQGGNVSGGMYSWNERLCIDAFVLLDKGDASSSSCSFCFGWRTDDECPGLALVFDVLKGILIVPCFLQIEDGDVGLLEGLEDSTLLLYVPHASNIP